MYLLLITITVIGCSGVHCDHAPNNVVLTVYIFAGFGGSAAARSLRLAYYLALCSFNLRTRSVALPTDEQLESRRSQFGVQSSTGIPRRYIQLRALSNY